jgi:hypothetical protein
MNDLDRRGRGRPSLYSQELAQEICHLIAGGETDASIEAMGDYPSAETLRRWTQIVRAAVRPTECSNVLLPKRRTGVEFVFSD